LIDLKKTRNLKNTLINSYYLYYCFFSRAKQEDSDKQQTQRRERRPPGPNLNSSRGRGNRNQPNLIQAHSIFEAGPAESLKRCNNFC
jgi:hypothetical protein